jgi:subtilisin family serine protease
VPSDIGCVPHRPTRPLAAVLAALALGAAAAPAAQAADPMSADQWALATPAATGASEAWTQSKGDGVVVAILDSGVQLDHPDLAANLWTNPGEVAGNGVDDDRNGYVDDVHGANMISPGQSTTDDEGHGTHVAGIVAASAGNGAGGTGIAPGAKIMSVKVLDANRSGNSSLLARGIRYAVDQGARILNVSLNGDGSSLDLEDALRYANDHGATVVASAGNNSRNIDAQPSYPASSAVPSVLSVTATDRTGSLLSIANHGQNSVDIAAPGGTILSTARGSDYELRQGTSMAAPFVAGSLALLAAARRDLPQSALRAALLDTAPRTGSLNGRLGSGGLDVGAAMHRLLPGAMWRTSPAAPAAGAASVKVLAKARMRKGSATVRWTSSGDQRVSRWRVTLDGRRVGNISNAKRSILRKRVSRAGKHRWTVVGVDAAGKKVVSAARSFRVVRAV